MRTICFTGRRPKNLPWGYNEQDERCIKLKKLLEEKIDVAPSCNCSESVTLLFTTKTCPNCKMAKSFLDKAGVNYKVVDAEEEPELVKQFGITQAPTLIVAEGENYDKYVNASNIKRFTENCG